MSSLKKYRRRASIAVAVSGGQDSLLALALAREQAVQEKRECVAVHGRFLPPTGVSLEREEEMARICKELKVQFLVADLVDTFYKRVIQPFVNEYLNGRTPNPCAHCNPVIKLGALLEYARIEVGADFLATGHYANTKWTKHGPALYRGKDPAKDQSYFLSLLKWNQLEKALFPLGELHKSQVPDELAKRGLTPPAPEESQEICFIPDDDYCAFLERTALKHHLELPGPGPVFLADGSLLGKHQGLWRYTLGQRRGLGIAHSEPLYVLEKDVETNALIVGSAQYTHRKGCTARQVNILVQPKHWPETVLAQTRYRQKAKPATAEYDRKRKELQISFLEPQGLPAPGQVAAIYDDTGRVLAAGVISA